jgi:site-specific recombinase XerD
MSATNHSKVTRTTFMNIYQDYLVDWANQFYQSKKVEGISTYSLIFYKQQLGHFLKYCDAQVIKQFEEITPNVIRNFLQWHEETGHNSGGLHAAFRVLRTFLLWYESEAEPENWKNPIHKVKAPKIPTLPLKPIELTDVSLLLNTCKSNSFLDYRDKALLMFLLDTGVRARELLQIEIQDVDPFTGEVLIQKGKGRKPRTVFLGKASRKSLRNYLKHRMDNIPSLWVTNVGECLEYGGLRGILVRRGNLAGINPPTLHSFRRAFAINMLRAGVDVFSLQKLMGHADLQVLRRYLAQTTEDIAQAHRIGSPVDNHKF